MTLVVIGQTGQLALELARVEPQARFLGRDVLDLARPDEVAESLVPHLTGARAVINAAAFTAVDRAEDNEDLAMAVNGLSPGIMAQAAARAGVAFVQASTDYVFDGSGDQPWRPGDETAPLGVYGRSKLAGEQAVQAAGGAYAVLRTSWVFSAHGANFVKTMLRLGRERAEVSVVADQIGGPTPAAELARACVTVADGLTRDRELSGVYHFSGSPDVSWAGFARAVFSEAGLGTEVKEIATADYPTRARRPLNSRLDCSATSAAFGITRPDWRVGLDDVLHELGEA